MAFIPQKKWKYAKPKKQMAFEEYLILPENKKSKMTIKGWNFASGNVDGDNRTIFRTDVIKMDGKETSRILVIKNYENVQQLRKELSRKKGIKEVADIEISRHYSEDDLDYYYKIEFLD
jgi:hypothetical protein